MSKRKKRKERQRAGSARRDSQHRAGGQLTTLTMPDGLDFFSPKEGSLRLDIIPYEVGKGNPYAEEGTWYWERTFYIHRNVGPNNDRYVCPFKTAEKKCPICEARGNLVRSGDEADEKMAKDLRPQQRQLFLVSPLKKGEDRKVKLWDVSPYCFGELFDKRRKEADEDEDYVRNFDDFDGGATLKCGFTEESGKYKYIDTHSIDFKPRPNGLDEDLLEHGYCLDDIVKIESYERLKAIFDGLEDADDDDDGDDKPKVKGKGKGKKKSKKEPKPAEPEEDDDDDEDGGDDDEPAFEVGQTVKHRTHGVCKVVKVRPGGRMWLEDGDEQTVKGISPEDCRLVEPSGDDDDDDDEEEADEPKKRKAKAKSSAKKKAKAKKAAEPDDDDDDEEEDEEDDDDADEDEDEEEDDDDDWE